MILKLFFRDTYVTALLTRIEQQGGTFNEERDIEALGSWLGEFFEARRDLLREELLWIEKVSSNHQLCVEDKSLKFFMDAQNAKNPLS